MKLTIEHVPPEQLRPAEYNPRQISKEALGALARLLDEHGFVDPVIARREDGLVIGGHQRLRANAMRHRPDSTVPVVFLEGISDDRAKALNVALNNPKAQGEYDRETLAVILAELGDSDMDLPAATGFAAADLARLASADEEDLPDEPAPIGPDAAEDEAAGVVVILEMTRTVFRTVKPTLDELVAGHDLACHVRMDGDA
jgi:ParB-like chromosome segregation protein Spo0J